MKRLNEATAARLLARHAEAYRLEVRSGETVAAAAAREAARLRSEGEAAKTPVGWLAWDARIQAFALTPETRKPNEDAAGRPLAGKPVYFGSAQPGDAITVAGLRWTVETTEANAVNVRRGDNRARFTYSELQRRGAFFAAV